MSPRPFKFPSPLGEGIGVRLWGRDGVSVFLSPHTPYIIYPNVTDPTPNPSPAWAGKGHILHFPEQYTIMGVKCISFPFLYMGDGLCYFLLMFPSPSTVA